MRVHHGRLWCNQKTDKEVLHYSTTFNFEEWYGVGDSGYVLVGLGDGDPVGISAITPAYRGEIFTGKATKLYRVIGETPEDYQAVLHTEGIGIVSHNSCVAVDQQDVFFTSYRGFHSLSATDKFGAFEGAFLSSKIQRTFNEDFTRSLLPLTTGCYIPEINSVAFTATDETVNEPSSSQFNAIYLYNIEGVDPETGMRTGFWYRWPSVDCAAIFKAEDSDTSRFYICRTDTRLAKALDVGTSDIDTDGTEVPVLMTLKTGYIFPEGDEYTVKGMKNLLLYYRPIGNSTVTVGLKIDNLPSQSVSFQSDLSGGILGVDLILGTATLGGALVMSPYSRDIQGYGRGIQIVMAKSGVSEEVEIQGFGIVYERGEGVPEVQETS